MRYLTVKNLNENETTARALYIKAFHQSITPHSNFSHCGTIVLLLAHPLHIL